MSQESGNHFSVNKKEVIHLFFGRSRQLLLFLSMTKTIIVTIKVNNATMNIPKLIRTFNEPMSSF